MAASHGPNLEAVRQETGALVRARRKALDLSQGELAERCDTDTSQISAFETGKRRLSLDWLVVIARALDCCVVDLLPASERGEQVKGEEAELVDVFRHLPDAGREHFLNLAHAYAMPITNGGEPFKRAGGSLTIEVSNFRDLQLKAG